MYVPNGKKASNADFPDHPRCCQERNVAYDW